MKKIGFLILFLIFLAGNIFADPLDNWHWRLPLPQGNPLFDAAYGNNTFVVVGEYGTIILESLKGIVFQGYIRINREYYL